MFSQAISGESVIDCFFRNASCANLVATGFLRNESIVCGRTWILVCLQVIHALSEV